MGGGGRYEKYAFRSIQHVWIEFRLLLLLLLLLKEVGRAKQRESDIQYTHFQFEDPSTTIPTYRQNEEKGTNSRRLYSRDRAA